MTATLIRKPKFPPLQNGDHMDRVEFERRYRAMPDARAELIEGVVYMSSPVRVTEHGEQHFDLITWFGHYRAVTPGIRAGDNSTARLDEANQPQPDVMVFIDPACGGQAQIDGDGYVRGAPELVAEISGSTLSIDLNAKWAMYLRAGVREYLVWRVEDGAIDWFVSRGGRFERLASDDGGLTRSTVFPGLWLDSSALTGRDLAAVLTGLNRGLASLEHAAFAAGLKE